MISKKIKQAYLGLEKKMRDFIKKQPVSATSGYRQYSKLRIH